MSTIVKNKSAEGVNLSGTNFGMDIVYAECSFRGSDMQNANLSESSFVNCDFRGVNILNTVFKFSCGQGSGNKLDQFQVASFIFWLLNVADFDVSMRVQLETLITPYKYRLEQMFNRGG